MLCDSALLSCGVGVERPHSSRDGSKSTFEMSRRGAVNLNDLHQHDKLNKLDRKESSMYSYREPNVDAP